MSEENKHATARSPMAGCAILIAALLVMAFLVVFSTLTLFRQFDEIAKFTSPQASPVPVDVLAGNDSRLAALGARLESFRQQLDSDSPATIRLSAGDLNLAIAGYDHFNELRGTFHVASIGSGEMRIAISFPMNGRPRFAGEGERGFITSDSRYLNAVMVARPQLIKQEVVLKIDDILVEGADVPEEFIQQMSPYRLMERYLVDPVLGPVMAKLTRVEIDGDQVVVTRVPGELPAGEISEEAVGAAGSRFLKVLGAAALLFLVFAGIMVSVGLKKTADRS